MCLQDCPLWARPKNLPASGRQQVRGASRFILVYARVCSCMRTIHSLFIRTYVLRYIHLNSCTYRTYVSHTHPHRW